MFMMAGRVAGTADDDDDDAAIGMKRRGDSPPWDEE